MGLSPEAWHRRFTQQARWTLSLRSYLAGRAGFRPGDHVLEVGCGTGAVLASRFTPASISTVGLDLNFQYLSLARRTGQALVQGNGLALPCADASFDHTFCHFLLLWTARPLSVLLEMRRVTRPGGAVLALAEPDYGGRIDYPHPLETLGRMQREALERQGADPLVGRRLNALLHQAGLDGVETGILGAEWKSPPTPEDWQAEWAVLQSDLKDLLPASDLEFLKKSDAEAWASGSRVLFVPTFFGWGRVPNIP